MSKLITNTIRHTGASSDSLTFNSDGHATVENNLTVDGTSTLTGNVTVAGSLTASNYAGRNVLYNGAMQVNQRGDAAATGSSGYFSADRWKTQNGTGAAWAISRSTDAPAGFAYSTKWDCTTADTSVGADHYIQITQDLEGQDVQRFQKGTATAKKFALQFWIKSTIAGTYIVNLLDSDNGRQIVKDYTISTADTWEKKTMVFDADTTGAFTVDNNKSLRVSFWLMAGSDYTSGSLSTTWAAESSTNKAFGQVNAASSTSNNVFITGVQLEVDTVTEFEHRSYGEELARCQRYFFRLVAGNNQAISVGGYYTNSLFTSHVYFPVTMRAAPTLDLGTGTDYYRIYHSGTNDNFNSFVQERTSTTGVCIDATSGVSGTEGNAGNMTTHNASAYVQFSAEL